MDIEKLIETLRQRGVAYVRAYGRYCSICDEVVTALSTLQGENKQLRGELEYEQEHANAYHEECGQCEAENEKLRAEVVRFNDLLASYQNVLVPELRAELEQVKKKNKYSAHDVALILSDAFGDSCACNFNGNDEWLPEKCELLDTCPDVVGVACWEQYLKWRGQKGD